MAMNVFAFDCLRTTFDLFVVGQYDMYDTGYEGYVPDSFYIDQGESQYYSVKYYRTDNYLDSTIEYYVHPDTTIQNLTIYNGQVEIEKDGPYKTIYIYKEGLKSQKILSYFEDDSLYYKTIVFVDKNEIVNEESSFYIRNDTIYSSDGSIIVRNAENEEECNVNVQADPSSPWTAVMTYNYETRGDTLIQTRLDRNERAIKVFYVPVATQHTTPVFTKKIYPVADWRKSKHFDLLGRPIKNKSKLGHTMQVTK